MKFIKIYLSMINIFMYVMKMDDRYDMMLDMNANMIINTRNMNV